MKKDIVIMTKYLYRLYILVCMLNVTNLVEINKNFAKGEIDKNEVINYSILKINDTENWVEQIAWLFHALLSENCFKDGNKETAIAILLTVMEIKKLPINQDKILNIVLVISRNHITDINRIKRLIKEVV